MARTCRRSATGPGGRVIELAANRDAFFENLMGQPRIKTVGARGIYADAVTGSGRRGTRLRSCPSGLAASLLDAAAPSAPPTRSCEQCGCSCFGFSVAPAIARPGWPACRRLQEECGLLNRSRPPCWLPWMPGWVAQAASRGNPGHRPRRRTAAEPSTPASAARDDRGPALAPTARAPLPVPIPVLKTQSAQASKTPKAYPGFRILWTRQTP
jgi:hypothetical protein